MPENDNQAVIQDCLQALVGLPLSIVRDVADMKAFHFGAIRPHRSGEGTTGSHALHIQCPWRIVNETAVVTGTSDRFTEPDERAGSADDAPQSGNLQRVRIAALLKEYDKSTASYVNAAGGLVVVSVSADKYGGADLFLSGGYRLQIFPDGSREEDWRLLQVGGKHLVIEGGQATVDE
jgi:hypothetical protein